MDFRRLTILVPIAITAAVIIGLALGPGSRTTAVENATIATATGTPAPSDTPSETPTDVPTGTPEALAETNTPTPILVPTLTSVPTVTRTRTPAGTATPVPRVVRVPILMYHYVSVPPPDADKYRLDLSVTPDAFQAQMDYLAANGYHTVRVADVAEYLANGTPLPDKPIVLSFDDGYEDSYTNALPILQSHKFAATFYIIAQFVEENRWGYLSWQQLGEMVKAGMEIGSHSMDHPDLRNKSRSYQTTEIAGSRLLISSRLATVVSTFAYPAGKYDNTTLAVLRTAGYQGAVTEIQGSRQSQANPFELRRVRIRGSYTVADFGYWVKYYAENGK